MFIPHEPSGGTLFLRRELARNNPREHTWAPLLKDGTYDLPSISVGAISVRVVELHQDRIMQW